ncbi:MAG: Cyclic dehypoxanthine futalosine synthase [Verrucomicrobiota bacterium]
MVAELSNPIIQKVWDGQRISPQDALELYQLPLDTLGILANHRRNLAKASAFNHQGNNIVTYIVDRNINYTNICNVYCKFCAFYRVAGDSDAYVISLDELDQKIEETLAQGGTQILLQGGHHPDLTIDWYLNLLNHLRTKFPTLNVHGFSPSEFIHFREVFQLPLDEIIQQFTQAGLGSIPGGGGEILVDRVRKRISPLKATSDQWLEVMEVAHKHGLATTATMMFGHVETIEDRLEHLIRLRDLQDRTRGFTAFICWTFQAENTKLRAPTVGAHEYLRMQALARIVLDNFDNIQSSWVTQGPEVGQVALRFGANDLGSIMLEENVVSQAGATYRMTVQDMQRLIRDLGYQPKQRNNWYQLVENPVEPQPASTPGS